MISCFYVDTALYTRAGTVGISQVYWKGPEGKIIATRNKHTYCPNFGI